MKRVIKLAGVAVASLAAVVAVVAVGAFGASEAMIRWPQTAPASKVVAATDAGAVERGHRLATLNGCNDCHGAALEGRMFDDIPGVVRAYAPNLSLIVAQHTDAELDAAIRHGVGVDHRPLWIMPSSAFSQMTDAETADLLAYLRTFKPTGQPQPRLEIRPMGRIGVLLGKFKPEPQVLAERAGQSLPDFGPEHAAGRQTARVCVECHGLQLKGDDFLKSPDLNVAAAYEPEDFAALMKTGVAAGGRKLGLMTAAARVRFHVLTDAEVSALQGYLKARAAAQPAA